MQIFSSLLVFAGGYLPCRSPPQAHHLRAIYLQINYAVLLFLLLGFLRMTVQNYVLCPRQGGLQVILLDPVLPKDLVSAERPEQLPTSTLIPGPGRSLGCLVRGWWVR
jgi:hypothetical protein